MGVSANSVDILVFAPHPDDETLGCGGVIMHALAAGKRVHVVFFTNGDGYTKAASMLVNKNIDNLSSWDYLELSRVRQLEVFAATKMLGLNPSNITFLGYPDGAVNKVYQSKDSNYFQSPTTLKKETYGLVQIDYHKLAYGKPAPYLKKFALSDTMDLIQIFQPKDIYVPEAADQHLDHMAVNWFVRDAIKVLGYQGRVHTYLIHSGPDSEWPWPQGITPRDPFAFHEALDFKGVPIPRFVPWPPPERVPLNEAVALQKLKAIRAYRSQLVDREYLQSFTKSEEIFWGMEPR
ncbi:MULTISPECIES: PIG-L deacetylase family protein [unclassified Bacillus (in: firmicutes)]|uniref:PIG-L deacetylase family protein n=1 Tax=unclassified Bacillus (in: firmicutes) TaxID=185979 RepID=UPI0020D263DE|nr:MULTISPECIES: PIG-L family deacetylase [unclassified Bacillus (in: firmicutes)]